MSGIEHGLVLGWPVALVMAAAVARERVRGTRRRAAINRGLHELRRPMQALALFPHGTGSGSGGEPATVELALGALDDLDREVNGGEPPARLRPLRCRPCVEGALGRWRVAAGRRRAAIELRWHAGEVTVLADPRRLVQALENMLANSLEHGSPPVRVEVTAADGKLRLAVRDAGPADRRRARVRRRDARRGHGLAVVARIAAEHGGRFVLSRGDDGATAVLELPLAGVASPSIVPARAA